MRSRCTACTDGHEHAENHAVLARRDSTMSGMTSTRLGPRLRLDVQRCSGWLPSQPVHSQIFSTNANICCRYHRLLAQRVDGRRIASAIAYASRKSFL